MDFTPLGIDPLPLDAELTDAAAVGPELAHLGRAYCDTPRALVWRNASSEWPLLVLTLPIATRLSLLTNPIFGRLVREWGLSIRFLGVDRSGFVYDFRDLLDARALRRLITALGQWLAARDLRLAADDLDDAATERRLTDDAAIDTLFELLATETLTVLEQRRGDWAMHLARDGVLVPDDDEPAASGLSPSRPRGASTTLFERRARYPEFIAQLRDGLRQSAIDIDFYGRVLRAIDRREHDVESRIISIVESALDPITLARLARTPGGLHLGCYNWLLQDPRARAHRASTLNKLPAFAQFFADRLLAAATPTAREQMAERLVAQGLQGAGAEALLRGLARAVDSGQDAWTIVGLSRYFQVSDNLVRGLWRNCPAGLGMPPTWHLRQILQRLDRMSEREWPQDATGWAALKASAVPPTLVDG